MMKRIITHLTTECWQSAKQFEIQVTVRYVESTLEGGSTRRRVERYENLDEQEARQVLEAVAQGMWVGQDLMVNEDMTLFR